MSSTLPFGTALIGQTENALGALLDRQLVGTGLTKSKWVALTMAVRSGGVDADHFTGRVAAALKISEAMANTQISELVDAGLMRAAERGSTVDATTAGYEVHSRVSSTLSETTERLWGDLPAGDKEAAARVLSAVLERANVELGAG